MITDRGLIREAQRASRKIRDMEPEIGELAASQAKLSLGEVNHGERKRLERRQRELEKALENAEREGEGTEDLAQQLFEVRAAVEAHDNIERQSRLTASEKRDLIRRRDKASELVRRGMSPINAEVREILDWAKSRGLARRVD